MICTLISDRNTPLAVSGTLLTQRKYRHVPRILTGLRLHNTTTGRSRSFSRGYRPDSPLITVRGATMILLPKRNRINGH